MHRKLGSLPKRSRRYGVGKEIGGAVYVHRTYEEVLGRSVAAAKRHLPPDFEYTVVKYHMTTGVVSFIHSPDFDSRAEPVVGTICTIALDGRTTLLDQPNDPYVYHHKWLFVKDDYLGFDVEESKVRSATWSTLPDVDRTRIGRLSYWEGKVLPKLNTGK